MFIRTKHVEKLGFESTEIFYRSYSYFYKKEFPDLKSFLILNNHSPQNIELFKLTTKQYRNYKNNKASLVPNGCCAPAAGNRQELSGKVMWEGEFKSQKHLKSIIDAVETLIKL